MQSDDSPPERPAGAPVQTVAGTAYWHDVSRSRSRLVRDLHDYWDARRGAGPMPQRADIDPAEIKPLLPYLMIADLVGDRPRVRYRLVGTKIAAATGLDFTGSYLDEFAPMDIDAQWHDFYRLVRDRRAPIYGETLIPAIKGLPAQYAFAIFPLGGAGAPVEQCLAVEDYGEANHNLAELTEKSRPRWMRHLRALRED